jgi:hypothetical protein
VRAGESIVRTATSWSGVTQAPHPEGGVELRYAGRPLGRVADDGAVEAVFHPRVRAMLIETGRLPAAGAEEGIELLRLAYERARVAQRVREARGSG